MPSGSIAPIPPSQIGWAKVLVTNMLTGLGLILVARTAIGWPLTGTSTVTSYRSAVLLSGSLSTSSGRLKTPTSTKIYSAVILWAPPMSFYSFVYDDIRSLEPQLGSSEVGVDHPSVAPSTSTMHVGRYGRLCARSTSGLLVMGNHHSEAPAIRAGFHAVIEGALGSSNQTSVVNCRRRRASVITCMYQLTNNKNHLKTSTPPYAPTMSALST
jgi:hypothetical protein